MDIQGTSQRQITYGQQTIDFEVSYGDRKNLDITVHPNQKSKKSTILTLFRWLKIVEKLCVD